MFNPAEDLRAYMLSLPTQCRPADLLDILRHARQLLEHEQLCGVYPTVSLYCNWHLHSVIDRQERGWRVLTAINLAIAQGGKETVNTINSALGLRELRQELLVLFQARHINTSVFTIDRNWDVFAFTVLFAISKKPLAWPAAPRGKAQKAFRAVQDNPPFAERREFFVRSAHVEADPDGFEGPGFYWVVRLLDGPFPLLMNGLLLRTLE